MEKSVSNHYVPRGQLLGYLTDLILEHNLEDATALVLELSESSQKELSKDEQKELAYKGVCGAINQMLSSKDLLQKGKENSLVCDFQKIVVGILQDDASSSSEK